MFHFNTNKPQSCFLWQNTSCIRKPQVISGGRCASPAPPPPQIPRTCNGIRRPHSGLACPWLCMFRDRRSIAQQCWIRLPQLFQHCWGHAHVLHIVCKVLWVVSFPRCTSSPNIDGSCCGHLHTILVPRARRFLVTWSGSLQIKQSGSKDENVCTQLPTWTQQLPTLLV